MIFCAVCQRLCSGSDGELYATPKKGVYEFICEKCANQIMEEAREDDAE